MIMARNLFNGIQLEAIISFGNFKKKRQTYIGSVRGMIQVFK